MSCERMQEVQLQQDRARALERNVRRSDDLTKAVRLQVGDIARGILSGLERQERQFEKARLADEERASKLSAELRAVEFETARRIADQIGQSQRGLRQIASNAAEISEARARKMESLEVQLRAQTDDTNQRLDSLEGQVQANMEAIRSEAAVQRDEVGTLIRTQGEKFSADLETQRGELQEALRSVQKKIDERETNQCGLAEAWIRDARGLVDHIAAHHRHEDFAPGALERLRGALQLCEGNMLQGVHEAAIASAQQVYLRASELRLELVRCEQEWEAHLTAARMEASHVLSICIAQAAACFLVETTDGPQTVESRIDFWTRGGLEAVTRASKDELDELEAGKATLEDLKQSLGRSTQRLADAYSLAERAKQSLLASQVRQNIAEAIAEGLAGAGYEVTDSAYEGGDFREALHVKLENLQGDQLLAILTPKEGPEETYANQLEVSFFDGSSNSIQLRDARLRAIHDQLRSAGVNCGESSLAPGGEHGHSHDHGKLDLERVRRTRSRGA